MTPADLLVQTDPAADGIALKNGMPTHAILYRVPYADTDNMGFVYHANYLRWFEIGRTEMFRALGLTYRVIESRGIFLPVSEAHCKFLTPARYDDLLRIETTLDTGLRGTMKFDYRVAGQDGRQIMARGYTKHAFVDGGGRVVRPPEYIRELIAAFR